MLDGLTNRMMKKMNKVSGLSILEAIVSTAIVGIGFIAILQMTNFSVQSINNSGDRTKANFLTEMIVEDVIGSRDTFWGVSSDDEDISYDSQGRATHTDNNFTDENGFLYTFVERINEDAWDSDAAANCVGNNAQATSNVYNNQEVDALQNKENKWNTIISENRFLKCTSTSEDKRLEVFDICRWDSCTFSSANVTDEPMHIGRVEMRLNNGKKRKYIYFQADYRLKTDLPGVQTPMGNQGGGS